jgi:anaerobic ribonucleoside-triphosphate reductase activating protein
VIWTQGCSLKCPGCYNPETHSFDGGTWLSINELYNRVAALGNSIEGITISGGEPLQQAEAMAIFLKKLKSSPGLSIILFTGYEWKELERVISEDNSLNSNDLHINRHTLKSILDSIDVLIAGRFIQSKRIAKGLRGSSNKTFHFFTNRYTAKDFESLPEAEIVIGPEGNLLISGINPPNLNL